MLVQSWSPSCCFVNGSLSSAFPVLSKAALHVQVVGNFTFTFLSHAYFSPLRKHGRSKNICCSQRENNEINLKPRAKHKYTGWGVFGLFPETLGILDQLSVTVGVKSLRAEMIPEVTWLVREAQAWHDAFSNPDSISVRASSPRDWLWFSVTVNKNESKNITWNNQPISLNLTCHLPLYK